jgi:methylase of polypeptide subunit release factors
MTAMLEQRPRPTFDTADMTLLGLLSELKAVGYRFVTATPATHARVLARPGHCVGSTLRDLLGWSLPAARGDIPPTILRGLETSGMIEGRGDIVRSRLRVSSLGDDLYYHSAYPTTADDAIFFGPDSYRFTELIRAELSNRPPRGNVHIVDIGTGAGVGAVMAARCCPGARITMTDINRSALRFAAINTSAAGVHADGVLAGDLAPIDAPIDIILANPPYIIDAAGRDYRDGGGMHGAEVALDMARMAVARLSPRGRFILYTGSAIIEGEDPLARALAGLAEQAGCRLRYRELDPDVFGEELSNSAYVDVDRIAVVAAVLERREPVR